VSEEKVEKAPQKKRKLIGKNWYFLFVK
jgi:hypothetical protein